MFFSLICSASPERFFISGQAHSDLLQERAIFFTSPEMYRSRPEQLRDLNWKQVVDATGGLLMYASPDGMSLHKPVRGELAGGDGAPQRQCRPLGVRINKIIPLTEGQLLHQPQAATGGVPLEQRFSDGRTHGHLPNQFRLPEGKLEASSAAGLQLDMNNGELMSAREESSVSDPSANGEASLVAPAKERKASQKGKIKLAEEDNTSTKPCRSMEKKKTETDLVKPNVQQSDNGNCNQNQGKNSNSKSPEPHKDYIHVRARRGQATDSHSLAERVRREKISQRMKLLQDLVPGCNKVTGKAVMLDEIINYVQSLERQVEFLSLKLATVNPQLDFNNMASFVPKDISMAYTSQPQQGNSIHCVFPNGMETQMLDTAFHQNLSTHHSFIAGFESASSQLGTFWEDDLENVTHMDIGHN